MTFSLSESLKKELEEEETPIEDRLGGWEEWLNCWVNWILNLSTGFRRKALEGYNLRDKGGDKGKR